MMRFQLNKLFILWLITIMALLGACGDEESAELNEATKSSGSLTLSVLQTSDLHANIMPWNYFSATPDPKRGLVKLASLIKQERANECSLLIDTGDAIQGSPLGTYYALVDNKPEHPMATMMNSLRYDAMELGNHEFNYGLPVLNKFISEVKFPVLGANIRRADGSEAYQPYIIKEVCGVKVGILGLVTPGISTWERPENIDGLRFDNPLETAREYVPRLREQGAEVVVLALHAGPDRTPPGNTAEGWLTDYETWKPTPTTVPNENLAIQIALEVPGIDGILSGHTHLAIPKMLINDVVMVQPKFNGAYLGKLSLEVERAEERWNVVGRDSALLALDEGIIEEEQAKEIAQPAHQTTLNFVEQPIGEATAPFPGGFAARLTDSPLGDLINTVQEDAARAAGFPVDLSIAAIFTDPGALPQGKIKLRDAYSVYLYDNTLYVLEINGGILRRALEKNSAYFATLDAQALPESPSLCKANPSGPDYNWDLYTGVEYTIDATKPVGSRLTSLRYKGQEVTDEMIFRVALNNYRGGGGGGYDMFKEGKVLWRSTDGVREMLVDFITRRGTIDPSAVSNCNFTLLPDLYGKYFSATTGPAFCPAPSGRLR